jgi:poly(3-hydroxybutyrate) depolymerase
MKTQLDEKQDLLRKVERLSSADEVQKVKVFIAGMEAGKAVREMECERAS